MKSLTWISPAAHRAGCSVKLRENVVYITQLSTPVFARPDTPTSLKTFPVTVGLTSGDMLLLDDGLTLLLAHGTDLEELRTRQTSTSFKFPSTGIATRAFRALVGAIMAFNGHLEANDKKGRMLTLRAPPAITAKARTPRDRSSRADFRKPIPQAIKALQDVLSSDQFKDLGPSDIAKVLIQVAPDSGWPGEEGPTRKHQPVPPRSARPKIIA